MTEGEPAQRALVVAPDRTPAPLANLALRTLAALKADETDHLPIFGDRRTGRAFRSRLRGRSARRPGRAGRWRGIDESGTRAGAVTG